MSDVRPFQPESGGAPTTTRLFGIEAGRLLCAWLVIVLHLLQSQPTGDGILQKHAMLQMVCRVSVPFFFIASGYFLRIPATVSWAIVLKPIKRLVPIYVIWAIIYNLVDAVVFHRIVQPSIDSLLFGGGGFHLWFLNGLLIGNIVVGLLVAGTGDRVAGVVCCLLAIVAVATSSYGYAFSLPPWIDQGIVLRFLGPPLFVYIGFAFARRKVRWGKLAAGALVVAGFVGIFCEETLIASGTGTPLASHDLTFSTYVYGSAVFLFFLNLAGSGTAAIGKWGKYTLGIYLTHLLFVWVIVRLYRSQSAAVALVEAVVIFALALGLTAVLLRVPIMRRVLQ